MNLKKIVESLKLSVRCGADNLKREITGGFVGDLLSDVIANSQEGNIWITRQIHQNIVAVASLKDIAAIILVQGSEPAAETLARAEQEGIPLLVTALPGFEVAGRIYKMLNP
jgi:predicted transcriptional regulator